MAVTLYDTPTLEIQSGKRKKHVMASAKIVDILMREVGRCANVVICLEKASANPMSIPGKPGEKERVQGTVSMFSYGEGFGIWQGILAGLQLPYTLVHPRTWKTQIMRDMGKEKGASIVRACQLYPMAADRLTRKKDHGRSDALLLAHYGRMYVQPTAMEMYEKPKQPDGLGLSLLGNHGIFEAF